MAVSSEDEGLCCVHVQWNRSACGAAAVYKLFNFVSPLCSELRRTHLRMRQPQEDLALELVLEPLSGLLSD